MDPAQGMVAVVRGVRDSGLAVTLLENGRQYTLAPNTYTAANPSSSNPSSMPLYNMSSGNMSGNMLGHMPYGQMPFQPQHLPGHGQGMPIGPQLRSVATDAALNDKVCSGTQAVDGRYASVYQTTVGKMKPTSPLVELTEFPPQRPGPAQCPGHDNFVVGGTGSGDTSYNPVRIPNSFRGGMCWSNRGSVYSPRPSRQLNTFENSLRKYPRLSPERSSEIVERLITYSQAKNYGKNPPRCQNSNSQTRNFDYVDQTDLYRSRSPTKLAKGCDTAMFRIGESPTREPARKYDPVYMDSRKPRYGEIYDVRYIRDMSRMVREHAKSLNNASNPYSPSYHNPRERPERYDNPVPRRVPAEHNMPRSIPMVNSEIQAAATMVCRESSTVPGSHLSKRNVSASAEVEHVSEGGVFPTQKSVQTLSTLHTVFKSVQTTLSTIEIPSTSFVSAVRRTKSEENVRSKRDMQTEILEKLDKIHQESHVSSKVSGKIKKCEKDWSFTSRIVPIWYKDCDRRCHGAKKRLMSDFSFFETGFSVYRAEVVPLAATTDPQRKIIKAWLNEVPLKKHDFLGRVIKKEQILSYVICRLSMIPNTIQMDTRRFRAEVFDIVDDIPIDIVSKSKYIYVSKLSEDLISKLESERIRSLYGDKKFRWNRSQIIYTSSTGSGYKRVNQPLEYQLRLFVKKKLTESIQKSQLDLDANKVASLETDLVDVLVDYLEDIKCGNDMEAKYEIAMLLRDTGQILQNQATNFATLLVQDLKKMNLGENECDKKYTEMHNADEAKVTRCETLNNTNAANSQPNTSTCQENDIKANEEAYMQLLEKKIEKWLINFVKDLPFAQNSAHYQSIANGLAKDIVDRNKYSELNLAHHFSERDEIEHLKYQIFKWFNKLGGENNTINLEKAPDLMDIIKSVPKPVLTKQKAINHESPISERINRHAVRFSRSVETKPSITALAQELTCKFEDILPSPFGNILEECTSGRNDQQQMTSNHRMTTWCSNPISVMTVRGGSISETPAAVQKINEEFVDFVKEWVHTIPIDEKAGDKEFTEKLRLGLFHGVWKAIAKVKATPGTLGNQFHYEDALDDQIEELYTLLPQTDELASKKHLIKVKLIEKVSEVNEKIKATYAPETFGQQIVNGVSVYLPRVETTTRGEDTNKLFEDLQILNLADEYIMFIRYREEDPIKANVYKTKLLKKIQEFVQELKKTYNTELKDIDTDMYMNDILAAIQQVPLPSNETIEKEADMAMLGMEIDKWFADLPLHTATDRYELLKRRRLRDGLAKKIYDLEKTLDFTDSSADQQLKHEVSQVLEKLPLEKDESVKINVMVEELANRIRNRQRGKGKPTCKPTCRGRCKSLGTSTGVQYGGGVVPASGGMAGMPSNGAMAGIPASAGMARIPGTGAMSSMPATGGMLGTGAMTGMPGMGTMAGMSGTGGMPGTGPMAGMPATRANMSGMPASGAMSSMPASGAMSSMPSTGGMSQMPGTGAMPGDFTQGPAPQMYSQAIGPSYAPQQPISEAHWSSIPPNAIYPPPKSQMLGNDGRMWYSFDDAILGQRSPMVTLPPLSTSAGPVLGGTTGGLLGGRPMGGGPVGSGSMRGKPVGGGPMGGPTGGPMGGGSMTGGPMGGGPMGSQPMSGGTMGGGPMGGGSMGAGAMGAMGNVSGSIGPVPPSAIYPPPTDMMQDAAGRTWYAFDDRTPPPMYQSMSPGQGQYPQGMAEQAQPNAADGTFWLSQRLRDYEAAHPPVATPNTSVQFGPPRSKVIQDPTQFVEQRPVSSSFQYVPQSFGGAPQSYAPAPSQGVVNPGQQSFGGPLQYGLGPGQENYAPPSQSFAPQQSVGGSMAQGINQSANGGGPWPVITSKDQATQQHSYDVPRGDTSIVQGGGNSEPSQFASLDATRAPGGMWGNQPQGLTGIGAGPGGQGAAGRTGAGGPSGFGGPSVGGIEGPGRAAVGMPSGMQGLGMGYGTGGPSSAGPGGMGSVRPGSMGGRGTMGPAGVGTTQGNVGYGYGGPGGQLGGSDVSGGMGTAGRPVCLAGMGGEGCPRGTGQSGCADKPEQAGMSGQRRASGDRSLDPKALQAANETTGPMWLSKYLKEYEANHPAYATPQGSYDDPSYGGFGQGRLSGSSKQGADQGTRYGAGQGSGQGPGQRPGHGQDIGQGQGIGPGASYRADQGGVFSAPKACQCRAQNAAQPCQCQLAKRDEQPQNRSMSQCMAQRSSLGAQAGGQQGAQSAGMQTGFQGQVCTNVPQEQNPTDRPTLLGVGTYILPSQEPASCGTKVLEIGVGPPGPRRSRGTQPKRQDDGTDDSEDGGRCRCLERLRMRKGGRGLCHNFNLLDFACPYRYFPPPPCYY